MKVTTLPCSPHLGYHVGYARSEKYLWLNCTNLKSLRNAGRHNGSRLVPKHNEHESYPSCILSMAGHQKAHFLPFMVYPRRDPRCSRGAPNTQVGCLICTALSTTPVKAPDNQLCTGALNCPTFMAGTMPGSRVKPRQQGLRDPPVGLCLSLAQTIRCLKRRPNSSEGREPARGKGPPPDRHGLPAASQPTPEATLKLEASCRGSGPKKEPAMCTAGSQRLGP